MPALPSGPPPPRAPPPLPPPPALPAAPSLPSPPPPPAPSAAPAPPGHPPPPPSPFPLCPAARYLGVFLSPAGVTPLAPAGRPGLRTAVREHHLRPPPPPPLSAAWEQRLLGARQATSRVAGLPLSAMGRGLAISGYALSRILYHGEHEGVPPAAIAQLQHAAISAVDHSPSHFIGIREDVAFGRPCEGGFGLLPLRAHLLARSAATAARLVARWVEEQLRGPLHLRPAPAWHHLAAGILRHCCPALHPIQALLAAAFSTPADAACGRLTGYQQQQAFLPQPLLRFVVALQALGPLLWAGGAAPPGAAASVQQWVFQSGLSPRDVALHASSLRWRALARPQAGAAPAGALAAPAAAPPTAAAEPAAAGFVPPGVGGVGTVADFTALLTLPAASHRQARLAAFVRQAHGGAPASDAPHLLPPFLTALSLAWRTPWGNCHKETLWRLANNAVIAANGQVPRGPCRCGAARPADARDRHWQRQHVFWDCAVAQAVRRVLQRALPPGAVIQQRHLWLLCSPSPACRPAVWRVVAMAALTAMARGRAALWAGGRAGQPPLPPEHLLLAQQRACRELWLELASFVAGGRAPLQLAPPGEPARRWPGWESVGPGHPLIAVAPGPVLELLWPL
jgi:hypothetical protein